MIDLARLEIMPFPRAEREAGALPERVRLTVTCSPTHGLDHTVAVATRLRSLGHAITMHLAARMVRDRAHLDGLLTTLAEAGVDDTFIIGGDAASPHGAYASAVELLPTVHEHTHRPRRIGIAGYPEGHALISARSLADALQMKSRLADYIVTQLCFSPGAVRAWVEATRRAGVALPVFVGLPGVVDRRKLLEVGVRVGVGPSLAFLRKQGLGNLVRLSVNTSEKLYEALSPIVGDPRFGIDGFHYFTFNRLLETWRWARARSSRAPSDALREMTST